MNNGFFRRFSDTLKEFGKKDATICAAVAIVIIILAANIYINKNKDAPTGTYATPAASPQKSTATDIELRLENILSKIDGTGKIDVMITYQTCDASAGQEQPQPLGAVIIAEGADNLEVRIKIQQAVQTALGIEARQIKIFRMGK